MKRTSFYLIMIAFAAFAATACHHDATAEGSADSATEEKADLSNEFQDADIPAWDEDAEAAYPEQDPEPEPQPVVTPKPAKKATQPQGKRTIYVSGHGANGEVWGHVTLNGNTGRGTIHDADENTLSITCTRKGDELIATDQNSRQYVFKI